MNSFPYNPYPLGPLPYFIHYVLPDLMLPSLCSPTNQLIRLQIVPLLRSHLPFHFLPPFLSDIVRFLSFLSNISVSVFFPLPLSRPLRTISVFVTFQPQLSTSPSLFPPPLCRRSPSAPLPVSSPQLRPAGTKALPCRNTAYLKSRHRQENRLSC